MHLPQEFLFQNIIMLHGVVFLLIVHATPTDSCDLIISLTLNKK